MATKRRRVASAPAPTITFPLAARLYQLLKLLDSGPKTRESLVRRLRLGVRGFYRDLERLRKAGIEVLLEEGRYVLQGDADEATGRLPFPDPSLTLGEARELARGRSAAHRKLAAQVLRVTGRR